LSRSRIIPADRASGLNGWALGDFAVSAPDPAQRPDDTAALGPIGRESPALLAAPVDAEPVHFDPPVDPDELHRADLETLRREAREQGFHAGREAGHAAVAAEAAAFRLLVGHLRDLVEDLEQGIANDVMSLSLELAKQIVRTSLRVRPDLVLAVIREVSKGFQGFGDSPRLILNPADASLVRQAVEADPTAEWPWTVTEDAAVERGGCKFQTGTSEVDATLETRWRRVVASLGRDDAWLDLNL
jgi:flagellar assembly protein FliH